MRREADQKGFDVRRIRNDEYVKFIRRLNTWETSFILGKVLQIPLVEYRLTSVRKKRIIEEYQKDPEKMASLLKSYKDEYTPPPPRKKKVKPPPPPPPEEYDLEPTGKKGRPRKYKTKEEAYKAKLESNLLNAKRREKEKEERIRKEARERAVNASLKEANYQTRKTRGYGVDE
jgi:type IV secretory pathway VirB10-like protein